MIFKRLWLLFAVAFLAVVGATLTTGVERAQAPKPPVRKTTPPVGSKPTKQPVRPTTRPQSPPQKPSGPQYNLRIVASSENPIDGKAVREITHAAFNDHGTVTYSGSFAERGAGFFGYHKFLVTPSAVYTTASPANGFVFTSFGTPQINNQGMVAFPANYRREECRSRCAREGVLLDGRVVVEDGTTVDGRDLAGFPTHMTQDGSDPVFALGGNGDVLLAGWNRNRAFFLRNATVIADLNVPTNDLLTYGANRNGTFRYLARGDDQNSLRVCDIHHSCSVIPNAEVMGFVPRQLHVHHDGSTTIGKFPLGVRDATEDGLSVSIGVGSGVKIRARDGSEIGAITLQDIQKVTSQFGQVLDASINENGDVLILEKHDVRRDPVYVLILAQPACSVSVREISGMNADRRVALVQQNPGCRAPVVANACSTLVDGVEVAGALQEAVVGTMFRQAALTILRLAQIVVATDDVSELRKQAIQQGSCTRSASPTAPPEPECKPNDAKCEEDADARIRSAFENQEKLDGRLSLERSFKSISNLLNEHQEKLESVRASGGQTSSIEREIRAFQRQLRVLEQLLKR